VMETRFIRSAVLIRMDLLIMTRSGTSDSCAGCRFGCCVVWPIPASGPGAGSPGCALAAVAGTPGWAPAAGAAALVRSASATSCPNAREAGPAAKPKRNAAAIRFESFIQTSLTSEFCDVTLVAADDLHVVDTGDGRRGLGYLDHFFGSYRRGYGHAVDLSIAHGLRRLSVHVGWGLQSQLDPALRAGGREQLSIGRRDQKRDHGHVLGFAFGVMLQFFPRGQHRNVLQDRSGGGAYGVRVTGGIAGDNDIHVRAGTDEPGHRNYVIHLHRDGAHAGHNHRGQPGALPWVGHLAAQHYLICQHGEHHAAPCHLSQRMEYSLS